MAMMAALEIYSLTWALNIEEKGIQKKSNMNLSNLELRIFGREFHALLLKSRSLPSS
jgi:hypothetical protein